jgi:hypothetical protein
MEDQNTVNEPAVPYGQPLDFQQVWLMFKETDRMLTEKFQETEKLISENAKSIRDLEKYFTSQWGKLVESLVEGDLIKLLNKKGILVGHTTQRTKGNYQGENFEYDIIAYNGKEIVAVEVKTTLRPGDVKDFHRKIWKTKKYLPGYNDNIVYGAMAFITAEGASDKMAEKQGFFVIRATGSSSSIINQEDFKPKAF